MGAGDSSAMSPSMPSSSERSRLGPKTVVVIVVLVVLIAVVGFYVVFIIPVSLSPPTPGDTSSQQSSITNTTIPQCSVSASLPCGWTGSSQGIFVITNASLTVSPSTNSLGNGVLFLTLVHTGNYENTTLEVTIEPPGNTHYLNVLDTTAVGPTRTYWASIPTSFPLTRGLKYEVIVDSIYYETGVSGEAVTELVIALTAN